MRIGLMIGPELGRYRHKVAAARSRTPQAAERAGFTSIWVPQIPGDFDAFTMITLLGRATRADRARHRGPADPDPSSDRDGAGGAVEPGGVRGALHARARRRRTTGSSRAMLGLPYERPAHQLRNYLEVLNAALAGPGKVDVENDAYRVHSPMDVTDDAPTPVLLAALGPVMLRIAGEHGVGDDPVDGRRARDRRARRPAHHEGGGRADRRRASSPACPITLCAKDEVDAARERANRVLGHAEYSPELPATARAGRRHGRRRHPRGGRRVGHRRSPARLPRRRRHRPRGPHPLGRPRPRRARRVAPADRGVPRFALSGALTHSRRYAAVTRS